MCQSLQRTQVIRNSTLSVPLVTRVQGRLVTKEKGITSNIHGETAVFTQVMAPPVKHGKITTTSVKGKSYYY